VLIYGAGYLGLYFCDLLLANGVCPVAFLDRNRTLYGSTWEGVKVLSPSAGVKEYCDELVVVAHMDYQCVYPVIKSELLSMGYRHVCHIYEYAAEDTQQNIFAQQRMLIRLKNCLSVEHCEQAHGIAENLADEESRLVYMSIIDILARGLYTGRVSAHPLSEQYMAFDLYRPLQHEVIVDVGAGPKAEFMQEALQENWQFKRYYYFEPAGNIRGASVRYANDARVEFVDKAVGQACGKAYLRNYRDMNALLFRLPFNQSKNWLEVSIVSLDAYSFTDTPTFVKVDTEGWEKNVLCGGMTLLQHARPVLACAIYHYGSDFVEIPATLIAMLPNYSFYVRSYTNWSETIFYAVPDERRIQ